MSLGTDYGDVRIYPPPYYDYGSRYSYSSYGMRSAEEEYRRQYEAMMRYAQTNVPSPMMSPAKPAHVCLKSAPERKRKYLSGVVRYHRIRGVVDVAKLEKECSDPACVLARITK